MLRTPISRVLAPLSRAGRHHLNLAPATTTGSWNQLTRIDDQMRDMERSFGQLQRWMNSLWRDTMGDFGWPQTGLPLKVQGLLGPELESIRSLSMMQPEIVKEGDQAKYRINLHMGDEFPPENVKVSLKDHTMTVEAKLDQKSDDGSSRIYREVSRVFTLPKEVNVKEVKTLMGQNGVLQIEAPLPEEVMKSIEDAGKPKEIPIQLQ